MNTRAPTGPLYRIAWGTDPWEYPDWKRAGKDSSSQAHTFGNRFDDPDAEYRVLYASSQLVSCYIEVLPRFRRDYALLAELRAMEGEDDYQQIGVIPDPDLTYYLARASGLLSKQMYDALIASHPESARANEASAENYLALHKAKEAEAYHLAALRERPDIPGIHLALGQLYAQTGQWDRAEEQFRAEVQLQPGSAVAAYRLGSALLQNGRTHDAGAELKRADSLQPDMPETLYYLGEAEFLKGDYSAAEQEWKRVIALEKTGSLSSQSHFGMASIYRKEGKIPGAQGEMQLFEKSRTPNH